MLVCIVVEFNLTLKDTTVKHLKIAIFSLVAGLLFSSLSVAATQPSTFTPTQVQQIQQVIGDYLVKNPEILVKASRALQKKELVKAEQRAKVAIRKYAKQIFADPNSPVVGNPNGNVTLVEFLDYQCIHCKAMGPIIATLIKKNTNLRVVFKELPIFGNKSRYAAKVALAVYQKDPKQYYAFHSALLDSKKPLTKDMVLADLKPFADSNSALQGNALEQTLASTVVKQQLKDNFSLAQKLGLMGTPAFVLSNQAGNKVAFVPGATTEQKLQQMIDKLAQ